MRLLWRLETAKGVGRSWRDLPGDGDARDGASREGLTAGRQRMTERETGIWRGCGWARPGFSPARAPGERGRARRGPRLRAASAQRRGGRQAWLGPGNFGAVRPDRNLGGRLFRLDFMGAARTQGPGSSSGEPLPWQGPLRPCPRRSGERGTRTVPQELRGCVSQEPLDRSFFGGLIVVFFLSFSLYILPC